MKKLFISFAAIFALIFGVMATTGLPVPVFLFVENPCAGEINPHVKLHFSDGRLKVKGSVDVSDNAAFIGCLNKVANSYPLHPKVRNIRISSAPLVPSSKIEARGRLTLYQSSSMRRDTKLQEGYVKWDFKESGLELSSYINLDVPGEFYNKYDKKFITDAEISSRLFCWGKLESMDISADSKFIHGVISIGKQLDCG